MRLVLLTALVFSISSASAEPDPRFSGTWKLIPEQSTSVELYGTLTINSALHRDGVTLVQKWGTSRSFTDSLRLATGGRSTRVPITDRVFPTDVFMGLKMAVGENRDISANWSADGRTLTTVDRFNVRASQGMQAMVVTSTYELDAEEEVLTYTIRRSTRPDAPLVFTLKREGWRDAYMMRLEDNWNINEMLPTQAMLIGLQGLANADEPSLYFIYPDTWDFRFTPTVYDYLRNQRQYTFTELKTAQAALTAFRDKVKGYVVWDPAVRTSLIVAFTAAGVHEAVIVTEDMIPMVEAMGVPKVADFRGRFAGMNDAEIYSWAVDEYWDRTSRDVIVWMGGEHGAIMKPGVADYGIHRRAFFNDLSTLRTDSVEYDMADKLLGEMNPMGLVMGWHSYKKDKERDHVSLTSSHGLRVDGLHTLPNLSFSSQVPVTPGFQFRNNHNLTPGEAIVPEDKVYIAAVQTDGLGLGAWTRPGRGEIPYAWEVTMNWQWLAPAMLEYFYSQATPNDFFIGGLSGPGYMYPKAIPPAVLPGMLAEGRRLMDLLDINVFSIMDYSEGATVEGNAELTKEVVDAYYHATPDFIGYVNGYAPTFTFTSREGVPFMSYDYYLAPTRSEADAIADLKELMAINAMRPYFLLLHVRQWSDITRVKLILDSLGTPQEVEVVPLDRFLRMAGQEPTFEEHFLPSRR